MQIIRDPVTGVADPDLRTLISRVFTCVSDCPEILGFILVVEPGDTLAELEAQLGFSILDRRQEFIQEHDHWFELVFVTGHKDQFEPMVVFQEFIQEHDHWFELVFVTGQDGYGFEVFLSKSDGINPDLLAMCQRYATPGSV